jgi:hypothetical protein
MKKAIRQSIIFCLLVMMALPNVWANEKSKQRKPTLMAKVGARHQALVLKDLDVEVRIHGSLVQTKMTMTFFNPHDRILEGQFLFPLPDGAFVSGYALDVNGRMVDGVVVEKKKARVVFEKIVRRGIDPGLVEWVKGNNFKTRVYPIQPGGTRTISLSYVSQTFTRQGESFFRLPIGFDRKVDTFSLKVEAIQARKKPVVLEGVPAAFRFRRVGNGFQAKIRLKDYRLDRHLLIRLPAQVRQSVQVEKGSDGQYYFSVNLPEKVAGLRRKPVKSSNPGSQKKRMTIFWDASHSRGSFSHQRELRLIRDYLLSIQSEMISVRLVLFRDKQAKPVTFHIAKKERKAQIETLLQKIEDTDYDGGTCMASVSPLRGVEKPDIYLLFSDGISTFGDERPGDFKVPVYAFSSSPGANSSLLRHLARTSGGVYFNLGQLADAEVLRSIGRKAYSFISLDSRSGTVCSTFPRGPQPVPGRFRLCGKLLKDETDITLNFGVAGRILKRITVKISKRDADAGKLLQTFWAQKKIADLVVFARQNRDELIRIGKKYGLVTPGTSLMVLERLEQYVEFGIEPPESMPQMRHQYKKLVSGRQESLETLKKEKIEEVVRLWQERVKWWNRTFKDAPARPVAPSEIEEEIDEKQFGFDFGVEGGVAGGVEGGVSGAVLPLSIDPAPASTPPPSISIKPWTPSTPYLAEIKAAGPDKAFARYMEQKVIYGNSPAFYLDCADYFLEQNRQALCVQILSNIAELELEDARLLRVLGHRLNQLEKLELSSQVFETVLKLRPEEPQSFRDLALVLARLKKYKRAIDLLYHVVTTRWDRFLGIEVTALMELNRFLAQAKAAGIDGFDIDPRLVKLLDVDVRIVLTWDTDSTDMDLWVTDPLKEKTYYQNRLSRIGGLMPYDFTEGYGPEEYVLKKAVPGKYKIQVNYYGSQAQTLLGPVTLQVDIFTNWGRKDQRKKSITLRLKERKEVITVGDVRFHKP